MKKSASTKPRVSPLRVQPTAGSLAVNTPGTTAGATVLGKLLPKSTLNTLLVDYAGNGAGPLRARTTLKLDVVEVNQAVQTEQPVVLLFENGDPLLPIVTGFIQPDPKALSLVPAPTTSNQQAPQPGNDSSAKVESLVDVKVDGKRVLLEGTEEITLKCGKASIILKADGRVVVRGAYVETYSQGVNRIKGGSVRIN